MGAAGKKGGIAEKYKDKGLRVIVFASKSDRAIRSKLKSFGLDCPIYSYGGNLLLNKRFFDTIVLRKKISDDDFFFLDEYDKPIANKDKQRIDDKGNVINDENGNPILISDDEIIYVPTGVPQDSCIVQGKRKAGNSGAYTDTAAYEPYIKGAFGF